MLKLLCFGPLELRDCPSTRVSSQHLLLLSYLLLEGPTPRWTLARLFWPHSDGAFTKKGERKDLSNLGVVLTNLRGACDLDFDDIHSLERLPCDAVEFERLLEQGEAESALSLYARGRFLEGLEHRSRLRLGGELEDWVLERRSHFERQARAAMVQLARVALKNEKFEQARSWAEQAVRISTSSKDFEAQEKLAQTLEQLGSPLAGPIQASLQAAHEELAARLPPETFQYYLLLALQRPPNHTVAQQAAQLSTRDAARCREHLLEVGLLTAQGGLEQAVARHHFAQRPLGKLTLLAALRDYTPLEQAGPLYSELYGLSGNFGGIGYWTRARGAYCHEARALLHRDAYLEAAQWLEQFEQAERLNGQAPHPDNRVLQAYALERLGQRTRGLEVLEGVISTPEVEALRSALLVQLEEGGRAESLARGVMSGMYGEASAFARALALNTLGQSAYGKEQYLHSERFFEQSAILWAVAGYPKRELGGLMNRATALERLGRHTEVYQLYSDLLERVGSETLRVRILLNLGYLAERQQDWHTAAQRYRESCELGTTLDLEQRDAALMANVLGNLGYAEHQLGHPRAARAHLQQAMRLALGVDNQVRYALALGNLGIVERSSTKLEMAIGLLADQGQHGYVQQYTTLYQTLLRKLLFESRAAHQSAESSFYQTELERLSNPTPEEPAPREPAPREPAPREPPSPGLAR